jgi:hypothetical protein
MLIYQFIVFLLSSNGRQTVGDGAFYVDAAPSVLAVCHLQGADDMYYYSTTFSGGPEVRTFYFTLFFIVCLLPFQWRF